MSKQNRAGRKPEHQNPGTEARSVHFYLLLDRSGSMESMRQDVIGGYNAFIADQQAQPGRARVTLVQFDSQDDQELLCEAAAIARAPRLDEASFVPRGGTPLLDATRRLVERARGRAAVREILGRSAEEVVFVTITDGEENQSRHTNLGDVQALVARGREDGWNFVFLGAGVDAYQEAGRLGYDDGSVQAFDAAGAEEMWKSVSRAATALRHDVAAGVEFDKAAYFRGIKEAEARRRRS